MVWRNNGLAQCDVCGWTCRNRITCQAEFRFSLCVWKKPGPGYHVYCIRCMMAFECPPGVQNQNPYFLEEYVTLQDAVEGRARLMTPPPDSEAAANPGTVPHSQQRQQQWRQSQRQQQRHHCQRAVVPAPAVSSSSAAASSVAAGAYFLTPDPASLPPAGTTTVTSGAPAPVVTGLGVDQTMCLLVCWINCYVRFWT